MIEIYLLEQLHAFEQYGTLSAASEQLHLSQPALTHSMQKLEELMGVELFERKKNRITLNENGKLTARYAEKILEQERDMIERVRLFDKSRRTLTLGSCAPVPVADLVPLLTQMFGGMTIASEVKNHDRELLEGLQRGYYQIVVLHEEPKGPDLYWKAYREERLSLSVPEDHPLSKYSELTLREIDGQNLLLYTEIGFWYEMCREKLPNTHFLLMNEYDVFGEIAGTGVFPSFVSDIVKDGKYVQKGKKIIPILDDEVKVTYYCVCRASDKKRFQPLYHQLEDSDWEKNLTAL